MYIAKRSSLKIFSAVVQALILREIRTRFGAQKFGYLWVVIDSLAPIIMFAIIHAYMMRGQNIAYDYTVFLATGFIFYNFFKSIMTRSIDAFSSNQALFAYKQVRPFDTIISRYIVEWLTMSASVVFMVLIGFVVGLDMHLNDLTMLLIAIIWFSLFGVSMGILFAVLGTFFENIKKIINLVFLPMFFLSGLFYTAESLPQELRDILVYNPILHFVELIHGSYFVALDTRYVDYNYMIFWTLIPLLSGLWLYRRSEEGIVSS